MGVRKWAVHQATLRHAYRDVGYREMKPNNMKQYEKLAHKREYEGRHLDDDVADILLIAFYLSFSWLSLWQAST